MTNTDTEPLSGGATRPSAYADEMQQASAAFADAKDKLASKGGEKVDAAATTAGDSLRQVADQLRQAGDNLGDESDWAKQAFSQGAQGLERVSGYLTEGRFDDFARDLQRLAHDNPTAFLAGSVAIGFLAARVAKTAVEHAAPSSQQTGQSGSDRSPSLEEPRSFASPPDSAASVTEGVS